MICVTETWLLFLLHIVITATGVSKLKDTCEISTTESITTCGVAINGTVCLVCPTSHVDKTASWYHDGKRIYRFNNSVSDKDIYAIGCYNDSYSLRVSIIGVQEASFSCNTRRVTYIFNLQTRVKPTITIQKISVPNRKDQIFDCVISGLVASVNLTWFINGRKRGNQDVMKSMDQLYTYTIPIVGPFPKGESEISCKASGPHIFTTTNKTVIFINGSHETNSGLVVLYIIVPCLFLASVLTSFFLYYKAKNNKHRKLERRRQSGYLVDTANFDEQNYEGNGRLYSDITKEADESMTNLENKAMPSGGKKYSLVSRLKMSGSFEYWSANYVTESFVEEKCFVKTLSGLATMKDATTFQDLALHLKSLKNSNCVISILSASVEEIPYSICYEYMECGSVRDFVLRRYQQARTSQIDMSVANPEIVPANVQRQTEELLTFASMIAEALKIISSQKFSHPALSLKKVLLSEYCECKLYDIYPTEMAMTRINYLLQKDDPPVAWIAAETIFLQEYQKSSDVWSFAVLLWELFSLGGTPFARNTREEIERKIREGVVLEQPLCCPGAM
ncbi:Fibroblast growth factor receptor 1 [Holothuria leucospilota]|uniref:Fibroblast growth factor receptor 1 n=1 Tax=Holothuria leucospilota TaxID=206669 RepID=A0A9Q1BZ08_HOLLE|nr:Fibroblast growth factor receptor 1 [Holothuria leucospilota]